MTDQNTKINFAIDYGNEKTVYEDIGKQKEFLKGVFSTAIANVHKNGVSKEYLKRWRDIAKKIEEAEGVELSLTTHELKLLKEVFNQATWQAGAYPLVCQIFDLLDEAGAAT